MSEFHPDYLLVHTAAFSGHNCDAAAIDRWHREFGWNGIGYHFVILNHRCEGKADGTVESVRPLDRPGAHVKGFNARSIGICCSGHGDQEPLTFAQGVALIRLLRELMERYGISAGNILGHYEINRLVEKGNLKAEYRTSKTCPGRMVDMGMIRNLAVFPDPPIDL